VSGKRARRGDGAVALTAVERERLEAFKRAAPMLRAGPYHEYEEEGGVKFLMKRPCEAHGYTHRSNHVAFHLDLGTLDGYFDCIKLGGASVRWGERSYADLVPAELRPPGPEDVLRGDVGLADAFYRLYARANVRTVDERGNAYEWDEARRIWRKQAPIYVRNKMPEVLEPVLAAMERRLRARLKRADGEDPALAGQLKRLRRLQASVLMSTTTKGVLEVLLSKTRDEDLEARLDRRPDALPIRGGRLLDLRTLEVRPRTREDLFSFELDVDFQGRGAYPHAERFFTEIACGDRDLVRVLQRLLGYCLTGEISERALFIWWGEGRNGKSTVVDLMKRILGRMYSAIDERVLMQQERRGGATPELMPLLAARLAVLSEIGQHERLNARRVKELTGGDDVSARALYGHQLTFRPRCKLVMLTNHRPDVDVGDQALVDRIRLVPFLARFDVSRENKAYVDALMTEHLDEMFSWVAEGARGWYREGRPGCAAMRTEMDR